jgi:hypothetical protein
LVPSADDVTGRCLGFIGEAQVECWAKLDQYQMERAVPWIPWLFQTETRRVSARVDTYSFDQLSGSDAQPVTGPSAGRCGFAMSQEYRRVPPTPSAP